jgi:hypothetical protein
LHPLTDTSSCTVESQQWPVYTLDAPQNFVFEQNVSSHAEPDTFRAEGIKYLSNLILARAGTDCESLSRVVHRTLGMRSTWRSRSVLVEMVVGGHTLSRHEAES